MRPYINYSSHVDHMSMPPGLPIPQKLEDGQQQVLASVAKSLAGLAQYLQSGLTMDQDSEFEYKDSDGTVQGPFLGSQLSEWNEAVRRLLFIPPLVLLTLVVLLSSSNQPTNQRTNQPCYLQFFVSSVFFSSFVRNANLLI